MISTHQHMEHEVIRVSTCGAHLTFSGQTCDLDLRSTETCLHISPVDRPMTSIVTRRPSACAHGTQRVVPIFSSNCSIPALGRR